LANCGNLYFPDLNFTDFGEKTLNFTNFGLKKQVLAMFDTLFVRKIIFHPNLALPPLANIFGENKKKNWKKLEKIGENMVKLQKYGTMVISDRK
jgi:uncharacterized protein YukJ